MTLPTLAVVSGGPGTGKTTLAHQLAQPLGCPAILVADFQVLLWELFQRVAPPAPTRRQGGGRRRAEDRSVLAGIVPPKGDLTGQNPVDCGKPGSKIHLLTDRAGLPISVGISAANTHGKLGLEPLVRGIPPVRSRHGLRWQCPAKLHADKGYDFSDLHRWLHSRNIVPRIAGRGVETSNRLGRHCWVVERTVSWMNGFRRLHRRYARKADHFLAFVGIAAALIYYRHLAK